MSPQAGWILQEEIVPRLRSAIPRNVNFVGSEDAEELIQDSICLAAKLLDNAEKQNKTVTAGNIAYYTILHMKSGRRSCSSSNSDVLGTGTQLNGRSTINSLEETVAGDEGDEIFQIHDVLSNDHEDPAEKAARKMDWDEFLGSLTERERMLVESMLAGKNRTQAARSIGVSTWTITHDKTELAQKILEFMGADILVTIAKIPGWKNNLNAERELLACKYDRRH
jgi:hypothetical protein